MRSDKQKARESLVAQNIFYNNYLFASIKVIK